MDGIADLICPVVSTEQEDDFRNVIEHAIAQGKGANIIFALGLTGEFYVLTQQDKKDLANIAVDEVKKQIKLIKEDPNFDPRGTSLPKIAIGITGDNMDETTELAGYAEDLGADYGVLLPIYITRKKSNNFSRRGVTENVKEVLKNTNTLEIMLYNNPHITSNKNICTATWKKLSNKKRFNKQSRIYALKDSSGKPKRLFNYRRAAAGNAKVYAGDEKIGLTSPGDGVVAGSSNVLPVAWSIGVTTATGISIPKGSLTHTIYELSKKYSANPIGAFKYMLSQLGVISSHKTFDNNLRLNQTQTTIIDDLLRSQDFQLAYGLNPRFKSQ